MGKYLVTGCAGFVGSNLADKLLKEGKFVVGLDNFDNFYDPKVKWENLENARKNKRFRFYEADILNEDDLEKIFKNENIEKVVHLAARPGVRPSIKDPVFYARNNVEGTVKLLDYSKKNKVSKFIFASSSSVYGQTDKIPFEEEGNIESLVSPYGASKRCGELYVESFYRSYLLKSIIFRFFTVYGQRGRPDMAPALFSKAILKDREIKQFGDGESFRDYTYIDDIVDAIFAGLESKVDFAIINLGSDNPIKLKDFIKIVEALTGHNARIKKLPKQTGDVEKTWASIVKAKKLLGWTPQTKLEDGLKSYIKWLKQS